MTALHDALARIEHDAASDFTSTRLAHDLSPVTHAVRRARVARASATAVAAVAVVASGSWAASAWRNTPDAGPGTLPTLDGVLTDAALSDIPAPLGPECEARAAEIDPETFAYGNGHLPEWTLCVLWDGETLLRADAAVALVAMHAAYKADTGDDLCTFMGYRTWQEEAELIQARGAQAWDAGSSAHGYGLAVDFCAEPAPNSAWLSINAQTFGWVQPTEANSDGANHWQFGDAYFAMMMSSEARELPAGVLDVYSRSSADEIAIALAAHYGLDREVALDALADALPADANGNIYGWIVPDYYALNQWPNIFAAAEGLVAIREDQLRELGVPEADWQRVLTQASLVETESRWPSDMPLVAQVIQNRLDLGMKLELHSTVVFFTGAEGPFVASTDLEIDSPYNTYQYAGLPPGPIATPSLDAIEAVLDPVPGDYLYFVVVNLETGEMRFATNYEDHLDNVRALNDWYASIGLQ